MSTESHFLCSVNASRKVSLPGYYPSSRSCNLSQRFITIHRIFRRQGESTARIAQIALSQNDFQASALSSPDENLMFLADCLQVP